MILNSRIQTLPPQLANQIAAGEVIERPSSVVKECCENSLDAGATDIRIVISQGGKRLIKVIDNGAGIHKDDLPLAISRHATSKVFAFDDLLNLSSMGFRGEALASIASISKFSLTSKHQSAEQAYTIQFDDFTQTPSITPANLSQGTQVSVSDIFYNTPARRQFLRTDKTENHQIEEVVKRLALSRYDVAFELTINDKRVWRCPSLSEPKQLSKRIQQLCGKGFIEHALYCDMEAPGFRLWGWISEVDYTRSSADMQYFYVNGRIVRDKVINHAVRQAYAELLYPGRHALFALYLECDPQEVDVNVHPTKHEVRFRQARSVHDFITHSVWQSAR